MKVHHYHFGKDGGTERFFINLVPALARRGVEQVSVIRSGRVWRPEIEGSTQIIENHFRKFSVSGLMLKWQIGNMLRDGPIDALMAWTPKANRLMPKTSKAIRIARLGDYPPKLDYYRNIDVLVCNAPDIIDHVRNMGWTRGVELISNFTRTEQVAPMPRRALDTPEGVPLVTALGRLIERKGFDVLLQAIAAVPDAHLWLAGEGGERASLEALASRLGIAGRVRFLGWQTDARSMIAAADVFCLPSRFEPLGNVVLEAWAQKRPVVSTRSQGPAWFMRDGENGLLVDIDDAAGMAKGIARLIEDRALAAAVAEGGHGTLMQQFSEEAVTSAYIELFKRKP